MDPTRGTRPTILAIDATNWLHQLWHAQQGKGVLTTLAARVERLAERLTPNHVVCCLDRRSFRHDLYVAYKATRKEKPAGLLADIAAAPEALSQVACVAEEDGYEADDLLASVAEMALTCGWRCVLATGDKDARQCLVGGEVTILKGFSIRGDEVKYSWYTAGDLRIEYDLAPEQWTSYQALCGDSGDNIPGCPGWGEKTTLASLKVAGTLQGCYDQQWSLPVTSRQRQALLAFRSQVDLMLKLVTLRRDAACLLEVVR